MNWASLVKVDQSQIWGLRPHVLNVFADDSIVTTFSTICWTWFFIFHYFSSYVIWIDIGHISNCFFKLQGVCNSCDLCEESHGYLLKTPRHRNWGIAHEATAAKKKEAPRSWDHELTEESPCDRKVGWWERTIPGEDHTIPYSYLFLVFWNLEWFSCEWWYIPYPMCLERWWEVIQKFGACTNTRPRQLAPGGLSMGRIHKLKNFRIGGETWRVFKSLDGWKLKL